MLKLFTDTDTDIDLTDAAKYGYNLISMPYSIDGRTYYPYEDYTEFDSHSFYDTLRSGVLPATSAISAEKYKSYFEPVFANGDDILYVHFSAAMTATFDVMHKALDELYEKYPERKFYEIDTLGITTISYAIASEIGELYLAGKTAEEIVGWAGEQISHFAMYFFADDLKFFRRSGRVNGLAAIMGNLIGVRPIIYMSEEGKMVSIGKEKGRQNAISRLCAYIDELGDDIYSHKVIIGHTDAYELALTVEEMLKKKYGEKLNTEIKVVNPTAGSHCGPNGIGVCFHAKHR